VDVDVDMDMDMDMDMSSLQIVCLLSHGSGGYRAVHRG
jgi:hypothetical protein